MPAFVPNEVPPLAIGLARRALDDMTELAAHTARLPGGPTVSEREVFHKKPARAQTSTVAARGGHRESLSPSWSAATASRVPGDDLQLALTTASVYAVE